MVRERRSRYPHLLLHLSYDHPLRMRRQQQPQNLQTRLRPERRKSQSAACHQGRIRFLHISIIAEVRKKSNSSLHLFPEERSASPAHLTFRLFGPGNRANLLLTAFGSHGILFVFGAPMKLYRFTLSAPFPPAGGWAPPAQPPPIPADGIAPAQENSSVQAAAASSRADAYFDYTMGHIFEQQYENTSK